MDILTVGIVTMPLLLKEKRTKPSFCKVINFKNVDSLIVLITISTLKFMETLVLKAGFSKADEFYLLHLRVLQRVITHHDKNIDLHDAKTKYSNSGTAIMGSAKRRKGSSKNKKC
jgi:cell division GTPase FtsZ